MTEMVIQSQNIFTVLLPQTDYQLLLPASGKLMRKAGCSRVKSCLSEWVPLKRSSAVFGGQYVGIREVADEIWLVSFMDFDLGFFDATENRVEPVGENPFAPKVLPMSSE